METLTVAFGLDVAGVLFLSAYEVKHCRFKPYHVPVEPSVRADIVCVYIAKDVSETFSELVMIICLPVEWSTSRCLVLRNNHADTVGAAGNT
jgi:hypothetical protein